MSVSMCVFLTLKIASMRLQLQMVPNQSDSDIPVPTLIRSIYLFRSGIDYEKGPRHVTAIFCF